MTRLLLLIVLAQTANAARAKSAPPSILRGWTDYSARELPHRPKSIGIASLQSPTGYQHFSDMHLAARHLLIPVLPALVIEVWRGTLYTMVQWNPQTVRPLPATRPHLWHTTLLRVWGLPMNTARRAAAALNGYMVTMVALIEAPNLLQLTRPPWARSGNFGLNVQAEAWTGAMQGLARNFVVQWLLNAEWSGELAPQAAELVQSEIRELHISWNV